MYADRPLKLLFAAVFSLATILRFGLAIVNREAFDDHAQVVNLILQYHELPETADCPECFQPKLFYFLAAAAIETAGINPDHPNSIILAMQLMNFGVGELVLLLAWLLIFQLRPNEPRSALLAFALLAFNPTLIAATGMPSNDGLSILLSSLAIYLCWRFLRGGGWRYLAGSGVVLAMAVATKTNTWGTVLAIFLTLLLKGVYEKKLSAAVLAPALLGGVLVVTLLNPLSQYLDNLRSYGTPVTLNVPREPFPFLIEKTYVRRPGIVSIQDGLLTFKLIDLLEYPRLTLGPTGYPAHRTSLWTDLYASANSVHFYNSPDSWHTRPDFEVTRSIFVLALAPTLLLLFGLGRSSLRLIRGGLQGPRELLAEEHYGLFDFVFIGYMAFVVALALAYRDFSTMKAVYVYPAVMSFAALFVAAADAFYGFLSKYNKWTTRLFDGSLVFLVVMYVVDVSRMIAHLYELNLR